MKKGGLSVHEKAIQDCRKVTKEYRRSTEPNALLLEKLDSLEKELLDEFFKEATSDKPAKKPRKKLEKPSQPEIPKIGT